MRVAVITPYCREPLEVVRAAHDSVLAQTHPCTHVLVGDGFPYPEIDDWGGLHLKLPEPHGDYGNTPRSLGAICALNQGFEAFAFLDADNLFEPDHVQSLVEVCTTTRAKVAFSERKVVLAGGAVWEPPIRRPPLSDIDTNCFFITDRAAFLLAAWAMIDRSIASVGDRFLHHLVWSRDLKRAYTRRRTVIYHSNLWDHYRSAGIQPPADAQRIDWAGVREAYSQDRQTRRLGYPPPPTKWGR